jgi:hypothetical protein
MRFEAAILLLFPVSASSDTVATQNTFQAGETARAAEVNENFTAVKDAVDGNDGLIDAHDALIAALETP